MIPTVDSTMSKLIYRLSFSTKKNQHEFLFGCVCTHGLLVVNFPIPRVPLEYLSVPLVGDTNWVGEKTPTP